MNTFSPKNCKQRWTFLQLKKVSLYSLVGFFLSFAIDWAIPITAFFVGYLSHLMADATTPSGLPRYKLTKQLKIKSEENKTIQAYTYTNSKGEEYYLHSKEVQLRNGCRQVIYYFAREINQTFALASLPAGSIISENSNSGLPFVKRQ